MLYLIRESQTDFSVNMAYCASEGETPRTISEYPDAESALRGNSELPWQKVTDEMREEDEIGGDILYIAEVP